MTLPPDPRGQASPAKLICALCGRALAEVAESADLYEPPAGSDHPPTVVHICDVCQEEMLRDEAVQRLALRHRHIDLRRGSERYH